MYQSLVNLRIYNLIIKIHKNKRLSFERERRESNESVDSLDQFLFEGDQMENRNFNEDYIKHQQINDHEKEDLRNDHNHSIERKKNIEKQIFFASATVFAFWQLIVTNFDAPSPSAATLLAKFNKTS